MKKKVCLLLALILSVGILAGCGGSDDAKKEGKTLVYGSSDYTAINPALYEHGEINSLIFLGLTTHNEKDEVAPGAAEKWSLTKKPTPIPFS